MHTKEEDKYIGAAPDTSQFHFWCILSTSQGGQVSRYLEENPCPHYASITTCATSAHLIGDAERMIQFGDSDAMVAGGT
ncbi:hypothetical protein C5167_017551 [Papaver somniferum]|uniref:Beta-ketoacyl synthase-like N-terminal domain-containing protein n=1 Tax=Papaver somniferum TaxID=3469 RepID=A0A4Y7INU6_PAPSO|nr:hypothetical protein C5167_017551 [Papaver somniferum]